MKYDFESIIDRSGKDSIAVDKFGSEGFGPDKDCDNDLSVIPMWVADMSFNTAPAVIEAIENRMQHHVFGYFSPSDQYYDAIINWQKVRNNVDGLTKENTGYENGVLGGVASALAVFCQPKEKILLHAPTYIGFTHTLFDNEYEIVLSDLVLDENNIWRMDFADMEKKIVENNIHTAIFCSPHNPTGRVWEKWEIEKAMALYQKYDINVISDEIWSDIILADYKHIPTQSVSQDAKNRTIAFYAPSKTFNLAGLVGSYHIVYNEQLHEKLLNYETRSHYNAMNVLSQHALIGGYSQEGMDWVDQLKEVLTENVNYSYDFINSHFEGIKLAKPQGTYMLYLDCKEYCLKHNLTMEQLLQKGYNMKVAWQDGRPFNKDYTIRMNLASPTSVVKEAWQRLAKVL